MDLIQKNDLLDETSTISETSKGHLATLAQWINIAAIVSFVSLGLTVLQLVLQFTKATGGYRSSPGAVDVIGQFIIIGITFLLNITLFNAAKYIKIGIAGSEQSYFNVGIRNLKSYFKIIGILVIILLVFFMLALIIGIFAASMGKGYR